MRTSAFLIRVIICFLLSIIPLNELEQRIYSARMSLRGPRSTPKKILIVEIESPNYLEFYWDNFVYRQILRTLLPTEPAALLVSWYIPKEIVDPLDPELSQLIRTKKLIWSSRFDPEGKFMRPAPRLIARSNYGFSNLLTDADGEVRQSWLVQNDQPSLVWATLSVISAPPKLSALPTDRPILINYAGPQGSILRCRFNEIVSSKAEPACLDLKDKIVLLDRTNDRFRTPFGEMDRAEILANELDTIVGGHTLWRAPWWLTSTLSLGMILLSAFLIVYYPVLISAAAITGSAIVISGILFQLLFMLGIYIPTANIAFSALITYLVFTGYRLAFQENLQWRSFKQGQYLKELDQMKTNFVSLISHDLKTPIAKIQAAIDRLKRDPSLTQEILESIENSNNELKSYILSILNLSKIESQKVILNKKSNDINQIIEQVLSRFKSFAQTREIEIEKSLEPLFSIECDEDLIRQVLSNLVDNAIKFSPPKSKIKVQSKEEDGKIRVDIQDFGPGIPTDQLPLMFRKFSRFQRPLGETVKGSGLGLYLSKYFIELHGGSIRLSTREGQGTTFTFTLPLQA